MSTEAVDVWRKVLTRVENTIDSPTVQLALHEVTPVTIDGHTFAGGLPVDRFYLSGHLQTFEVSSMVEDALNIAAGRPLAFGLFEGSTIEEWESYRDAAEAKAAAERNRSNPNLDWGAPLETDPKASRRRDVSPSWEALTERVQANSKTSPSIRHPYGQARFVVDCAELISDTIDLLCGGDLPSDPVQERALNRIIERVGTSVNLDPIFISLELMRYRQAKGKMNTFG